MKTMSKSAFCPKPSRSFCAGLAKLKSDFRVRLYPKNTVVATITVGTLPFSLAVGPDSSTVYVGNEYRIQFPVSIPQQMKLVSPSCQRPALLFSADA